MKFLVDAQLPRRLVRQFGDAGHDAVHTLDLPSGNRTTDAEICALADQEDRIVVTKDADFVETFALRGVPSGLLLISTGNISNHDLSDLLAANLSVVADGFSTFRFIEISRTHVIFHT